MSEDAVSEDAVTNENGSAPTDSAHEPHIRILRGRPTAAELAAVITVLASAGGGGEPAQPESTRWGLPVDRLRFAMSNYQRLTMQQMTHMKQ
ncbi:acyl-CoA carboxylase subunit epsilon [Mycobacterium sp. 050134]|uniref:acyl-CoA carboxylase subunit epsilon n=1 Tax=Mycobacterium sp. 050134 TaxID=3096111 RepID=UPI002ED7D935